MPLGRSMVAAGSTSCCSKELNGKYNGGRRRDTYPAESAQASRLVPRSARAVRARLSLVNQCRAQHRLHLSDGGISEASSGIRQPAPRDGGKPTRGRGPGDQQRRIRGGKRTAPDDTPADFDEAV